MLLILTALSGLAAAFAAPIVLSNDDDDDDEMSSAEKNALDSTENILDDAFSDDSLVQDPVSETFVQDAPADIFVQDAPTDIFVQDAPANIFVQDTLPEGETFGLEARAGSFEFEDFDPRVDVARIDMPDDTAMIRTGLATDGTPEVTASLSDGSDMTLTFPGLTEIPDRAIEFVIPGEDGDEDMVLSLADVLELGSDPSAEGAAPESIFVMEEAFDPLGLGALDDAIDDLADLLPLSPGTGDDIDELTEALDDLLPTPPGGGDDVDTPVEPLPGVAPISPNPGDETVLEPVAPGLGDVDDDIIPVPLPDGYTPLVPNPG